MATEEEKKAKTLTDPYADIRDLLYRQKPETREAEMRAEKIRAKATAFLQAFGTIADAFTLSRGGDVPKRDLNPYIMNSMQKADAMREQDRADRKAWDSSLLNLENSVAQYNIRQRELAGQKAREDEKIKQSQDFQKEMRDSEQKFRAEQGSAEHERKKELADIQNKYGTEKERRQFINDIFRDNNRSTNEQALYERKYQLESIYKPEKTGKTEKPETKKVWYTVRDPLDRTKTHDLTEWEALGIIGLIRRDPDLETEFSEFDEKGYSDNNIKMFISRIDTEYPEKMKQFLATVRGTDNQTDNQTKPAAAQPYWPPAAPQPYWSPAAPQSWPQGQGPVDPNAVNNDINTYF
jgi:hypothetical protein